MSVDHIGRAIFITNTFANAYPEEHIQLWNQFEREVPVNQRSGIYGADNLAYVRWLRKKQIPLVQEFFRNYNVHHSM